MKRANQAHQEDKWIAAALPEDMAKQEKEVQIKKELVEEGVRKMAGKPQKRAANQRKFAAKGRKRSKNSKDAFSLAVSNLFSGKVKYPVIFNTIDTATARKQSSYSRSSAKICWATMRAVT